MSNNIRKLRIERGLSMRDLADKIGAHFTTVGKLEKGDRPMTADWVLKFAKALEVEPSAIGDMNVGAIAGHSVNMVPIIGKIPAGNWREAVEHPEGFLPVMGGGVNCFALIPEGTSMNRTFQAGAYIVVDPDDVALLDGKIYAVMNGEGETTVKRFRTDPARLEPESDDERHRPILLGTHPITVIGRVIQEVRPH